MTFVLLAKYEVNMAGYWQISFFFFLRCVFIGQDRVDFHKFTHKKEQPS